MEVLLLEDIPGVGSRHDIIIVREGFALNNLLPRRRALVATPTVRRRYEEQIRRRAEAKAAEMEFKKSAAGAVAGKTVTLSKKITKTGKLYAAISEKHLAEAFKSQLKVEITEDSIVISEPIKSLGEHTVNVKMGENETEVKVVVEEEK